MSTQLTSPAKHSQPERRKGRRARLDLPLRVLIPRKDKTTIRSARGTDIGEGGMAVFVGAELKLKDEIFVEFTSPFSNEPLRVRAVIRSRKGYNYGLEFTKGTPDEKATTERFHELLRLAAGRHSTSPEQPA